MSASTILKLQKVGFTIEQVEALADFMDTQGASKADLFKVEANLKADLFKVEANLKADIAEVRAQGLRLEERVERRTAEIESRLIRWVVSVGILAVLTIGGMVGSAAWAIIRSLSAGMHP